jgi:DNA segregation ATPase FtsK/SpoIIIE-like protein
MKCDLKPVTSRIAFTCGMPSDSVTILGRGGAEKLSGNGDMYFISQKHSGLMYIKGADISSDEIIKVCEYIRVKYNETEWDDSFKFIIDATSLQSDEEEMDNMLDANLMATTKDIDDKQFAKIILWTLGRETVSANAIHLAFNNFDIGARLASRIIENLHSLGIVGDANGKQGRKVLPTCIDDLTENAIYILNNSGCATEDIKKAFDVKSI